MISPKVVTEIVYFTRRRNGTSYEWRIVMDKVTDSTRVSVTLLTYPRSGSSLTGDILQFHKDTFYVFEPFSLFFGCRNCTFRYTNGTYRRTQEYPVQYLQAEAMTGWLTCNFSMIPVSTLTHHFMAHGKKTKTVLRCLRNANRHLADPDKRQLKCIRNLEHLCQRSKFVIIKTIRSSMEMTETVAKGIANMKVIHLVRDPRATVQSQDDRKWCRKEHGGIERCAKTLCGDVINNTRYLDNSALLNNDSVFRLKYEDIAINPIVTIKSMYTFIGLNFTKNVADYVYNVTLGGEIARCVVCSRPWQVGTSRGNSTHHVTSWRTKMSQEGIKTTESHCIAVLNQYGYEPLKIKSYM